MSEKREVKTEESDEASGSNQPGSSGNADATEEVCAFCLDAIPDKDACFSTACTHVSHKPCLLRWLQNNRTCATCRTPVVAVKMKSGKNVALPELEPIPPEYPEPLTNEQWAAGEDLTTPEESETDEDEEEDFRTYRSQNMVASRRSARQRGQPARMTAAQRRAEADAEEFRSGFVNAAAARVGSSRSQRGGRAARGRGSAAVSRIRASPSPTSSTSSTSRRPRGMDFILPDVDVTSDEDEQAREEMREFAVDEVGEESESSGSDSTGSDSEEESGSEESELDDSVLDDDQPSTSRQMNPIVRKKRGAAKKKTTTKRKRKTTTKKKAEGGTVKRTTKRRKTTKKGAKRGTKRRGTNAEEAAEQRHRMRAAFPSLSLNGAAMDPLSADEDEPPAPKRARIPSPPPASASDPTDLLGSILTSQVVALTPGRHLKQEDGKLVPRDSINRHLDRLERRGVLPIDRAAVVAPSSSSSHPSSSRPVLAARPTALASTRTGASTNSSASVLTARPINTMLREANINRITPRPSTSSAQSAARVVPLVSPFERSTPLPRIYRPAALTPLPPAPSSGRALPPPSSSRLPSGFSRDSSHIVRRENPSEEDKKNAARIVKERMHSERSHQIREAVNSVLSSERRERRINEDEHRLLMKRIYRKFFDRLLFDRERVVEWTLIELAKLLEEKMFAPVTLN